MAAVAASLICYFVLRRVAYIPSEFTHNTNGLVTVSPLAVCSMRETRISQVGINNTTTATTTTTKTTKKWKSAPHSTVEYSIAHIANEEIVDAEVKATDDLMTLTMTMMVVKWKIRTIRKAIVTIYVRISFPCAYARITLRQRHDRSSLIDVFACAFRTQGDDDVEERKGMDRIKNVCGKRNIKESVYLFS